MFSGFFTSKNNLTLKFFYAKKILDKSVAVDLSSLVIVNYEYGFDID